MEIMMKRNDHTTKEISAKSLVTGNTLLDPSGVRLQLKILKDPQTEGFQMAIAPPKIS